MQNGHSHQSKCCDKNCYIQYNKYLYTFRYNYLDKRLCIPPHMSRYIQKNIPNYIPSEILLLLLLAEARLQEQ